MWYDGYKSDVSLSAKIRQHLFICPLRPVVCPNSSFVTHMLMGQLMEIFHRPRPLRYIKLVDTL